MKAEHRKQLQTNVLADRMGRLVQTLKQRPQKRTLLFIILGIAIIVGVFVYFRYRTSLRDEASQQWVKLSNGAAGFINELGGIEQTEQGSRLKSTWEFQKLNVGRAARLQYAWYVFWDLGMKALAAEPQRALRNLQAAGVVYSQLAEECKDDPVWEPEALYAMAVIEETLAVLDAKKHLPAAQQKYAALAAKFPKSARGEDAQKRADDLAKADSPTYQKIADFYDKLRTELGNPVLPIVRPREE